MARLFENYREVEEQYFQKTAIFPIMHTIIIRRDIYKENPWIAMNLYKAFCEAKDVSMRALAQTHVLAVALPWIQDEIERTQKTLGADWWPYGVQKNRHVLETFLRYHYEQGLSEKLMTIEGLFAPESLDAEFKI